MDILTLGLGLELGRQDVPGLKNTRVNFLASGRLHQDVADPRGYSPLLQQVSLLWIQTKTFCCARFQPLRIRTENLS